MLAVPRFAAGAAADFPRGLKPVYYLLYGTAEAVPSRLNHREVREKGSAAAGAAAES